MLARPCSWCTLCERGWHMGDFLYFLYESPCSKASLGPHHSPSLGLSVCLLFTPHYQHLSLSLSPLLCLFCLVLCLIFSASVYFSIYINSVPVCLFLFLISLALLISHRLPDAHFNSHQTLVFSAWWRKVVCCSIYSFNHVPWKLSFALSCGGLVPGKLCSESEWGLCILSGQA